MIAPVWLIKNTLSREVIQSRNHSTATVGHIQLCYHAIDIVATNRAICSRSVFVSCHFYMLDYLKLKVENYALHNAKISNEDAQQIGLSAYA